jgi:tRNA pseudouridine55 synthase
MTSHDVVSRLRRALGTRKIGHGGTLDPLATGLLVLGVGQGTKLLWFITDWDKEYDATVALGTETDTLDAEGQVVASAPVPALEVDGVQRIAASLCGPLLQIPPAYSAIKQAGEPVYRRARRGEVVELPARAVVLHSLLATLADAATLQLQLRCSKGFYVRSLARDLSTELGTLGHLSALRRTHVGPFALVEAVPWAMVDAAVIHGGAARQALATRLVPLGDAGRGLPVAVLNPQGLLDARCGRPIQLTDVEPPLAPTDGRLAVAAAPPPSVLAGALSGSTV